MQSWESNSDGYPAKELTVQEAATLLLQTVVGRKLSGLSVEDKLSFIPHATEALVNTAQGDGCGGVAHGSGPKLSVRQKEILEMLAVGKRPKQIARELDLAEITVRNYIQDLRGMFGVQSYSEAVSKARRMGYVS